MEKAKGVRELAEKAYSLGWEYQKTYRGCAQTVLAALQDTLGLRNDEIFKAATGLSGGGGTSIDGSCGAYAGAILFMSSIIGRERRDFKDAPRVRFQSFELARKLHDRFVGEYGAVICRDIQRKLVGRGYYLGDPDEMKKFDDLGGHATVAPGVVGNAARWTVEILAEKGLLPK
jgi:C_GCAxxG_C_C family probable redox protein